MFRSLFGIAMGTSLILCAGIFSSGGSDSASLISFFLRLSSRYSLAFTIRLCRPGISFPCMYSHSSANTIFTGFSGHVPVGQVYVFSLIPRWTMRCGALEYFFRNYGK